MSIITRVRHAAEAFRSDSTRWDTLLAMLGNGTTKAGTAVNQNTVLTLSAAYNAQVLVSETMSTVPLQIYKKAADGREEDSSHPLYEVLHLQANPSESAQTFRQRLVWDLELHGICLAEIIRDGQGRVRRLWHIPATDLSEVKLENDALAFHIGSAWMPASKVFYCYGPGQDGLSPRSRLKVMAESAGLGMAANEFGARFFSNGTHLGGFIEHPKNLKDEMYDRLKASINEKYAGLGNANKVILLEDGMKYVKTGSNNEESQFLETRQFQIGEIARFYNIPPHLIGDLSRSTNNNIENQGIEAVRYSWRPRAIRLESAINTQLIGPSERSKVYAEHNLNGLMQGDLQSQMQAWHLGLQDGIFNADEVRKWLNMNNQAGGQGDIYFMPSNMLDKQAVKDGLTLPKENEPATEPIAKENPPKEEKKRNLYAEYLQKTPSVEGYRALAMSMTGSFEDEFKTRFSMEEYQKSVEKLLKSQEKRTAKGFSLDEYPRMRNALRYAAMQASGVKAVVWRSKPDCPHCQHLNGQIRAIGESFVDGIRHAPLQSGCNCDIEEADHA